VKRAVVLFTRDLRVHDQRALSVATETAAEIVPMFVLDDALSHCHRSAPRRGNWQWMAGTGVDSRPNRVFNPIAQAKRLDRERDYVRAHVPELGELKSATIHEPWRAPLAARAPEYPGRIVDHEHRATRA
jgi:deoxyribodipyrimidine photolyase